jgi:mxaJ protein
LINNLRGYPVYGDYATSAPGRSIIDALDRGDIDVAVVWGPTAGYFALHDTQKLAITPVAPSRDQFLLPMVFDVAMGVRKDDTALRDRVGSALARRRADIAAVLRSYNVPLVGRMAAEAKNP